MKSLSKNQKRHILKGTILPALKWSSPTILAAAASYLETIILWELSVLGPTILARASLILTVSLVVLSAYSFTQWRNINKYEFDKFLGLWKETKADFYICSSCKSKSIISPMRETNEWFTCPIKECGHIAYKKGCGPPMPQTITSEAKSSFISGLDRYMD